MQDSNEKAEKKVKKFFFTYKYTSWYDRGLYSVSYPNELKAIEKSVKYWSSVDDVPMDKIKIIELYMPEEEFRKLNTKSRIKKVRAKMILSKNLEYRENYKEIQKNAQTLASLHNDRNSFFSTLAEETLVQIASLMGNNPNVIEDDKEGYEIAYKNFQPS
jgi:hypothetical protein